MKKKATKLKKCIGLDPVIKVYWRDMQTDTRLQQCSQAAKGVYFDLICLSCDMDIRGLFIKDKRPLAEGSILDLLRGNARINQKAWDELKKNKVIIRFTDLNGKVGWIIEWVYKNQLLSDIRKAAGEKGGNPNLVNQEVENLDNQNYNQKGTQQVNQKVNPAPAGAISNANSLSLSNYNFSNTNSTKVSDVLHEAEIYDRCIAKILGPFNAPEKKTFELIRLHLQNHATGHGVFIFANACKWALDKVQYTENRKKSITDARRMYVAEVKKRTRFSTKKGSKSQGVNGLRTA